jgi:hypothetical protein
MSRVRATQPRSPDDTRAARLVPCELNPQPRPKRLSCYERVVTTVGAMQRLGQVQDLGYGDCGRTLVVRGTHEAGTFEARLSCPQDRYCFTVQLTVQAPTDEERLLIGETATNAANLQSFAALFDLLACRTAAATFAPQETDAVMTALDCCFGSR